MKRSIIRECIRIAKSKNRPGIHPCWDAHKHYSFIIQDNHIIEMGINRRDAVRSFTVFRGFPKEANIHAEVDAYNKARGILNHDRSFEVFNIRLNKLGELRLSAPCPFCHRFLTSLDCQAIYFTTDTGVAKMLL